MDPSDVTFGERLASIHYSSTAHENTHASLERQVYNQIQPDVQLTLIPSSYEDVVTAVNMPVCHQTISPRIHNYLSSFVSLAQSCGAIAETNITTCMLF
jgi:hypothetical protein